MIRGAPQTLSEKELSAEAIESLSYPIHVYGPDGTSVFVNEAMLVEYHASDPGLVVGKYNVFRDPAVIATGVDFMSWNGRFKAKRSTSTTFECLWRTSRNAMACGISMSDPYTRT